MAVAGSLTYDTKIDKSGFDKGLKDIEGSVKTSGTKIKDIVSALGITKLISTAINVINNSIDGAISRIDTLNNFPKVMSNLGIASEESTKAINKLSDGLQGIPTTLDDAALAVQRFTSKNGDVDKSVDLFLAVNNALLAGGASAEIQSSALEQLSQAYAKGKPDMMEWRAIQTAMPAQLNQVAKAFGMTSDQLGEALRNGKISMDDFMNKIIELNKKGTGEFLSFAEQAKNSTGGIRTSITNAKTAITRGVSNIIKAFDEALKSKGLGGISTVISKIGSTAEKVLKKVASLIPPLVSKIKDIYNWIAKNQNVIKGLIRVIASLIAGYLAYKTVLIAINAIQMAKNILGTVSAFLSLIPAIKSAKDAMLLLNMAFSANPVGLVVAGIAALTVGIGASIIAIDKEKRSLGGLKEEVESQRKSWEELKKSREESLNSSNLEIATTQKLADELKQITDENGKVKEGYENRANYILGELNNALETEYKMNGNIIDQYKDLKDNIDDLIASKKAEAVLESYKSEYQVALKGQAEATKTLTELRQKYNEELNKTANGSWEEYKKSKNLRHIGQQLQEQSKLIGEYGYVIQNYETLTSASVSKNADEIDKAIKNMGISYDEMKTKTNTSLTEQINSQTKYVDLLSQSWKDATFNHDTFQTQILETQLETQAQELNNLAKSLAQQTSTVSELTEEQKEAWNNLANKSITAYNEGLSTLDSDTRKKVEQATGIVVNEVELPNGTKTLATNAAEGFKLNYNIDGTVSAKLIDTSQAIKNDTTVSNSSKILATSAKDGFNNNVDGKKWGKDLSDNISNGMQSQESKTKITGAATSIGGWIKSILGHSVPKDGPLKDELTYMPDMINNLVEGIEKNKYKVVRATNALAEDMKKGFNLEKMNDEIIHKMQNAVAIETGSINAKSSLQINREQPLVIARDTQTTINNTQNFYDKQDTPYEQQKQGIRQLRGLVYG